MVLPGHFVLVTVAALSGFFLYAYFAIQGCDPLSDGQVQNPNQVCNDGLQCYRKRIGFDVGYIM